MIQTIAIVRRALGALARAPGTTLIAVGAMSVALLLLGGARLVAANVETATSGWRAGVDMIVYLDDGTSETRARDIQAALEQLPAQEGSSEPYGVVIGHVVGVHIADHVIVDGRVDVMRLRPIARLGYTDYAVVDSMFSLNRPA